MADPSHLSSQFWGRGIDHMFPEGSAPIRTAPWPSMGRSKLVMDYDPGIVQEALHRPPVLHEIDPRTLRATQPSITRQGVDFYTHDETYRTTGRTFADQGNVGNKFPFIYEREDGQRLILAGHHRSAAALAKGEPVVARLERGPWGPPRQR